MHSLKFSLEQTAHPAQWFLGGQLAFHFQQKTQNTKNPLHNTYLMKIPLYDDYLMKNPLQNISCDEKSAT